MVSFIMKIYEGIWLRGGVILVMVIGGNILEKVIFWLSVKWCKIFGYVIFGLGVGICLVCFRSSKSGESVMRREYGKRWKILWS